MLEPKYEYLFYQFTVSKKFRKEASSTSTDFGSSSFGNLIRTGYSAVRDKEARRVRLNWEDYVQIYNFINKHDVSQRGADSLLAMLRDIHDRHNVRVPLPVNYKTILRCIENKTGIVEGMFEQR